MAKTKTHDALEALRQVPIFSSCSDRELRSIAAAGKEVTFSPGDVINREGEMGLGLHVVLEGETKVQVGGRTRRKLRAGAFFGEIALLDGGPRTATVIAETAVRTWTIPRWSFKPLLKQHPQLSLKILEEVCARLRSVDTLPTD